MPSSPRLRAAILALSIPLASGMAKECGSAAGVVADVFQRYRQASERLGCRQKLAGPGEFVLCGATRLVNETLDDMVGWWNTAAKNRWATLGPRILGAEIERGKIVLGTKRTFVSLVPSFNTGKVIVTAKQGKGAVTICATDDAGKAFELYDGVVVDQRRVFSISRKDAEGRVLSVVLAARTPTFQYEIEKSEEPQVMDFGPVTGLADLHVHGAAQLGFAGLWTWGSNDGLQENALAPCRRLNALDAFTALAPLEKKRVHAIPVKHEKHADEEVVYHGDGFVKGGQSWGDWPHFADIAHQQVHSDWLKAAHQRGLKLVVMCAVNNELLCRLMRTGLYQQKNDWPCDDMSNLKRQLEEFRRLDQRYDWFEIALTPWHARKIIHEGKLAVVLSAESSHMLPRSEGDFVAQLEKLYQLGLRSLQIVHERDNRFAGAAPHRKNFNWHQRTSNPLTWLSTMGDGRPFDLDANGKNAKGLSKEGERLLDAMIQRHMLIDTSHYSARSFLDAYRLVSGPKYGGYPLYASHSRFEDLLDAEGKELLREFLTTSDQLEKIKSLGGMVGVRTGPNHIKAHPGSGVENDCPGSSKSYAQMVAYAADKGLPIAFGSDFNGVTQQVGPRRGEDACYAATKSATRPWSRQPELPGVAKRFQEHGLRHIGYLPDLYDELLALRTKGAARLNQGAEAFLDMWERTYSSTKAAATPKTVNAPKGHCQTDPDCGAGNWCDKGLDLKKNVCRPKLAKGEVCGTVGELGVGHRCRSGSCKVAGLSKQLRCK